MTLPRRGKERKKKSLDFYNYPGALVQTLPERVLRMKPRHTALLSEGYLTSTLLK